MITLICHSAYTQYTKAREEGSKRLWLCFADASISSLCVCLCLMSPTLILIGTRCASCCQDAWANHPGYAAHKEATQTNNTQCRVMGTVLLFWFTLFSDSLCFVVQAQPLFFLCIHKRLGSSFLFVSLSAKIVNIGCRFEIYIEKHTMQHNVQYGVWGYEKWPLAMILTWSKCV